MFLKVRFVDINQHDDLHIDVDKMSNTIVYENEKWLNDNERLFVKIYDDGFVTYGLEMIKDPYHSNQRYTWSSNPEFVNETFKLTGTDKQLAYWEVAVKENEGRYSCYFGRGILLNVALALAEANQDLLHYGYKTFYKSNSREHFIIIHPREGVKLGNKLHTIIEDGEGTIYVECIDNDNTKGYMKLSALHDYVMKRRHGFCLGELFNTTL